MRAAGAPVGPIALLANTLATGAALVALTLTFGPISGARFNPAAPLRGPSTGRCGRMYPLGVMRHPTHRAMSWTLTITLVVGLLGAVSSSTASGLGGMQHCQWMTPAACCDQPLSVSGSSTPPKPAATIALLAPLPSVGTASWTPGHSSISGKPFYPRTVVLRL